ncbi:hypothetical protein T484DRAFT_1785518, partial [Baffinella frigidus]
MQPKLDLEGIENLNWRNYSIASYQFCIATSYISDASALLMLLQTNVRHIGKLLKGWTTSSMHLGRVKTLLAEEYLKQYQAYMMRRTAIFKEDGRTPYMMRRTAIFKEDGRTVHAKIAEIHLALHMSRGDPAWRQYVEHVNDFIFETLHLTIAECLQYVEHVNDFIFETLHLTIAECLQAIHLTLERESHKDGRPPLVEARLELVAPDVFFVPDVDNTIEGTGLVDMVDLWIASTIGVAKLLDRIDQGESSYYAEIASSPQVKHLVETIRDDASKVFEDLSAIRTSYEQYSVLWLQHPGEEFELFLKQ